VSANINVGDVIAFPFCPDKNFAGPANLDTLADQHLLVAVCNSISHHPTASTARRYVGSSRSIERAKTESEGLGLFVRSLVGLDRSAAKAAFGQFTEGKQLSANQLEFINLIVDHLSDRGTVSVESLYSSPYTDVSPRGPDGLFKPNEVDQLVDLLHDIRDRAVA
jgi:type I site-specific restriction endonuclease